LTFFKTAKFIKNHISVQDKHRQIRLKQQSKRRRYIILEDKTDAHK